MTSLEQLLSPLDYRIGDLVDVVGTDGTFILSGEVVAYKWRVDATTGNRVRLYIIADNLTGDVQEWPACYVYSANEERALGYPQRPLSSVQTHGASVDTGRFGRYLSALCLERDRQEAARRITLCSPTELAIYREFVL